MYSKHHARQQILPIFGWIAVGYVCLFLVAGYLETEMATRLFLDKVSNWEEICSQTTEGPALDYVKLTSFEEYRGRAELYCIYEDPNYNHLYELDRNEKEQTWNVIYSSKLNTERSLYWPLYY